MLLKAVTAKPVSLTLTGFFAIIERVMDETFLSRQHLDTLSTADLIELADDYGIDIPGDLNRRFIIGELLEAAEELRSEPDPEEDVQLTDNEVLSPAVLPKTYNDTKIYAVLRNPAWAFVFWDVKETLAKKVEAREDGEELFLRVRFFNSAGDEKPEDSFDMQITGQEKEQYVFIPTGKKHMIIALAMSSLGAAPQLLASTRMLAIPQESEQISTARPGKAFDMAPLVKLSGMERLLRDHYVNHRQSFSD